MRMEAQMCFSLLFSWSTNPHSHTVPHTSSSSSPPAPHHSLENYFGKRLCSLFFYSSFRYSLCNTEKGSEKALLGETYIAYINLSDHRPFFLQNTHKYTISLMSFWIESLGNASLTRRSFPSYYSLPHSLHVHSTDYSKLYPMGLMLFTWSLFSFKHEFLFSFHLTPFLGQRVPSEASPSVPIRQLNL